MSSRGAKRRGDPELQYIPKGNNFISWVATLALAMTVLFSMSPFFGKVLRIKFALS